MLQRLDLRGFTGDLVARLPRPQVAKEPPIAEVQALLADVAARGDAALREATERFDGVVLDELRVPPEEVAAALDEIPADLRAALEVAHRNI
jgi:histidinol dehydrogenase